MAATFLFLPAAYALGTFPTADLVARRAGHDVRHEGSGNPGASNVYRIAGRRAAVAVFAVDALKSAVATVAGIVAGGWGESGRAWGYALGAAAVIGHCFPLQRRFVGGKGVATAFGMMAVLHPILSLVLGLLWLAVVKLANKASLASLVAVVGGPVGVAVVGRPGWEVVAVAAIAAFIVGRHWRNLARLVKGEERSLRVGER